MKVVLFCGGLGTRMRGPFQDRPKPLVNVGKNTLIWNVMRYYAHHGHTDFILCLGYGSEEFKSYFRERGLEYIPTISPQGLSMCFRYPDEGNGYWNVTLVETGVHENVGQRLRAVRNYLVDEDIFLANYSDGLTNIPLKEMIDLIKANPDKIGALASVRPTHSFHYVRHDETGLVVGVDSSEHIDARINGGYFVFRQGIFEYLDDGDDLVGRPFERLIAQQKLLARPHDGFWRACDTLKDVQLLSEMLEAGPAPWEIWRTGTEISASPGDLVSTAASASPVG